jgi:UDP-glucose 4-epimerase
MSEHVKNLRYDLWLDENRLVQENILAMRNGKSGEVYNIGGGSRITVNDAIKIIEQITKKGARIEYKQSQKGDVKDTYADINKAKNQLNYKPNVNIENGLKLQIDSLKIS